MRAITAWKIAANSSEGVLFRGIDRHAHVGTVRLHKDSLGLVVKRAAGAAGLDSAKYAGHSSRCPRHSGALEGRGRTRHMRKTGHRSLVMIRRYIRDGSLFPQNPAVNLGL